MRKVALLAVFVLCFAVVASAQQNGQTALLDSPIKMDQDDVYRVGETVKCSLALPATAALFGMGQIRPPLSPDEFVTAELFAPFRVWRIDENCGVLSTWSTAITSGAITITGLYAPAGGTTYWQVDPFGSGAAVEFTLGSGAGTGNSRPLPTGFAGVWGPATHVSALNIYCFEDIASDVVVCQDITNNSITSSFPNPDNTGGAGAFGNGLGTAAISGLKCPGTFLVVSSGTLGEGQVTRVGHFDQTGVVNCQNTWSVGQFSTFVNGIDEFDGGGGNNCLAAVDNVTSIILMLGKPAGIQDCQGQDPDTGVLWVNGSQGGGTFTVNVSTAGTMSTAIQQVPNPGNRKFVHQMHSGAPSAGSLTPLFDLGTACFNFLGGGAVVVENNVGKTGAVGASNYFGSPIADPAKAPTFLDSLTQVTIDTGNLPAGSTFTEQAIVINTAASSTNGASLTNGVVVTIN